MDLKNLTREQLQAMGLDEAQIDAILGAAAANSKVGGLPFPLLKVNFDMDFGKVGAWGFNPIKEEGTTTGYECVVEVAKVRFLKSLYQYSKFDSVENRATITSNVFALKDAKKAYDLKTGTPINTLKATDDGIKFQRILLGVLECEDKEVPFIMYAKGSFLFELNDILKKFPNDGHMTHRLELGTEKRKKGTVVWFVPTLVGDEQLEQTEFISNIKKDADYIKAFDEWAKQINSGAEDDNTTAPTPVPNDNEEDDDEIAF